MFIAYCGRNATHVEDMCDILNHLSSQTGSCQAFKCDCDVKHRAKQGINWNMWTEKQIQGADYVLLVCSHQLHDCLYQRKGQTNIETATGQVSAESISNLFSLDAANTKKFIPVFLNQPVNTEVVPIALVGRKVYQVNTTGLMALKTEDRNFDQAVTDYLTEHMENEAKGLIELVECLRGSYEP